MIRSFSQPGSSLLTTHVYETSLLGRICVRAPYFALRDLAFDGERFSAWAKAELPRGLERTPMAAAEVGRHSAIAGLCCAAMSQRDETRRYYLAQRAEYRGFRPTSRSGEVRFESELERLDKRGAVARVRAEAEGQPLAEVRVSYTILTAAAFERLFRHQTRQTAPAPVDGYSAALRGELEQTSDTLRLHVAEVPLEVCAGHFENYPAMPVAALMSQLSQLAGQLVGEPYYVKDGLVSADDLLWAGSAAVFEAKRVAHMGNEHRFVCRALAGGRVKGEMEMTFVTTS